MNLEQAIAAMRQGKRITKVNLNTNEYMYFDKSLGYIRWNTSEICLNIGNENFFDDKYELYEDPEEIKVGDYVQVSYFSDMKFDKYKWRVNFIFNDFDSKKPNSYSITCDELNYGHVVMKEHCKKLPAVDADFPEIDGTYPKVPKPHEYKVGDKVWYKATIVDTNKGTPLLIIRSNDTTRNMTTCIYEIKPRGDDE